MPPDQEPIALRYGAWWLALFGCCSSPRASARWLNVLQRVGGSIGGVVLTVMLSRHLTSAHAAGGQAAAGAFNTTWIWAVAITAVAIVPAFLLACVESGARRSAAASAASAASAAHKIPA